MCVSGVNVIMTLSVTQPVCEHPLNNVHDKQVNKMYLLALCITKQVDNRLYSPVHFQIFMLYFAYFAISNRDTVPSMP